MKKKMKKRIGIGLTLIVCVFLASCGNGSLTETDKEAEIAELNIAYQYGLAYAPLLIAQEQNLIEQAYLEISGNTVNVTWNQMSAGADINTGIASGNIQVGFLGVAPAITGVMNDVGYKIFTNLSGQEHGLMTNNPDIASIGDLIGSTYQIALVNIGSIQHIILARALQYAGYDAHALDSNLAAMKHPDGMASLENGAVACHLTTNPYLYQERGETGLFEIDGISAVWTAENSFIVGVASEELYENNPELYEALCKAMEEAVTYMNENPEAAAEITHEYDGNSIEDEIRYIKAGSYSTVTDGILECAKFMAKEQFIEKTPENYSELVFDNVKGD